MFLIHQLRRLDVLPAGDLGIRTAVQRAYALTDVPLIDDVRQRGSGLVAVPHARSHPALAIAPVTSG